MPDWLDITLLGLATVAGLVAIVAINRAQRREGKYDATDDDDQGLR